MLSTNLSQILGGLGEELKAPASKSSMKRLATTGLRGDSIFPPKFCTKLVSIAFSLRP